MHVQRGRDVEMDLSFNCVSKCLQMKVASNLPWPWKGQSGEERKKNKIVKQCLMIFCWYSVNNDKVYTVNKQVI